MTAFLANAQHAGWNEEDIIDEIDQEKEVDDEELAEQQIDFEDEEWDDEEEGDDFEDEQIDEVLVKKPD
jgi:hypothetical protein